jgi:DNA processing protein
LVPGRVTDKYSQGCNNLIKTQSKCAPAADLVYILNWDIRRNQARTKQLFVTLDDDEQKVYDYLLKTEEIDGYALRCEFLFIKYQECC